MNDILDTIKILYEDMGPETARELFTVFPILKKIPELYRIALGNFSSSKNEEFNKTYESMDTSDPQKMALAIKILMEEDSKNHRGYTVMNASNGYGLKLNDIGTGVMGESDDIIKSKKKIYGSN